MANILVVVWSGIVFVWTKCPRWITYPLLITVGPNLIVNLLLFYFVLIPFFAQQWNVLAQPDKNLRDNQIKEIVLTNNFQYQQLTQRMDTFQQHQSLMMSELLRRAGDK